MSKKVFIIGGGLAYHRMFKHNSFEICDSVNEADLVVFTGGEDVSPSLYGDTRIHQNTWTNPERDVKEQHLFMFCLENKIPMAGICRGGQFLNVMSGGKMYQHVTEHTNSHHITDIRTGEVVYVSSTHHQMMRPGKKADVVAIANLKGQREYLEGEVFKIEESAVDYEVLFYKETNALCFQPHPEMIMPDSQMTKYFFGLIEEFLIKNEATTS